MDEVQKASEKAVRDLFKRLAHEKGRNVFDTEDFMDDGSRIKLQIRIDPNTGNTKFDFTGTSPQAYGMSWTSGLSYKLFSFVTNVSRKLECTPSSVKCRHHIYFTIAREC